MREFLRRCPACGRHFTVRLQSRKLLDKEEHTERVVHDLVTIGGMGLGSGNVMPAGITYEDVPIERDEFAVTFECGSCHHRWTETVTKVEKGK